MRLHCRRSVSVPRVLPSRMQRSGLPAGENQPVRQLHRAGAPTVRRPSKVASKDVLPSRTQRIGLPAGENQPVRQLHRDGASTVRRPSKVASKGGRPRRKAAQENKAAKDTEDPLVKLERAVALLDRGLVSVREYELLKQHILTDLVSTALRWPATAQDQGRGGGRPLEDACSFTARERGSSASEVGTGRVREVGSSTRASVRHAKSHTLEPTAAVEPAQHGAKVDGGSRRPPAFAAESLEPISCSPTAVGVTVAVQSHIQVQARKAMVRGKQQEASKPLATSPRSAAATRCGAKGPSSVGEDAKTRPLARGRARGERRSPSAAHASSGWGRSIPADRLDISSSTAGAQRTVSREFIMGWGRGKSAAQKFSPATARGTTVSSASDRELVRKFVRESLLGVPEKYRGPYFAYPRKDPFAGEWDPDWVVLRGSDNDVQTSQSSASSSQMEREVTETDVADVSALCGSDHSPVSDTSASPALEQTSHSNASAPQIKREVAEAPQIGREVAEGGSADDARLARSCNRCAGRRCPGGRQLLPWTTAALVGFNV